MSAPRLTIMELPSHTGMDPFRRILRHWLTLDDGRIFYQDEMLQEHGDGWISTRDPGWTELPSPSSHATVVGVIDHGGFPLAVLSNGASYIHASQVGVAGERWVPYLAPVPETLRAAQQEEILQTGRDDEFLNMDRPL